MLTVVGVFGVMSLSVSRRTHEIGVRMALGAGRGRIFGMIVSQVSLPVGMGLAWGMTRFVVSLLYGVSATDTTSFCTASHPALWATPASTRRLAAFGVGTGRGTQREA